MKAILRISLAALFAAALTGCGGFSSGLPKDSVLQDLTSDEAKQLCEEEVEFYEKQLDEDFGKKFGCYVLAVMFAGFDEDPAAACEENYEECLEDETEHDPCDGVEYPFSETVGEYEDCVNDQIEVSKDFQSEAKDQMTFACDPDGWDDEFDWMEDERFDPPESCKPFEG